MNRRRLARSSFAVVALAAALFGARAMWGSSSSPKHTRNEASAEAAGEERAAMPNPKRRSEAEAGAAGAVGAMGETNPLGERARSLRGTDVDGALRVGPDGKLLIGPDVLRLFDHFFTTLGEESEARIRERILAAIHERVSGPAAEQAEALLEKYLQYRKDAESLRLSKAEEADPSARLAATKKMRQRVFGDEDADKLFGDEEREGEVAIAEAKVRQDETLSAEERDKRLAALEADLPESARAAREAATLPLRARDEVAAIRAEGATDEDVKNYRTETFGAEAADRLAALDRERAAWKARIEEFEKERAKLDASIDDEKAFAAAEQALLDKTFSPLEQRRVRATLAMREK